MNYHLYDLDIVTIGNPKEFNCSHVVGEGLLVSGENISFKPNTKRFSHYVLGALVPFIAAKQRAQQPNDWMYFESVIACPDPLCGAKFNITRTHKRVCDYEPIKDISE